MLLKVSNPYRDTICYSLDQGKTRFYDLLQLVEFYQLNQGCLPCRLTYYIVQMTIQAMGSGVVGGCDQTQRGAEHSALPAATFQQSSGAYSDTRSVPGSF